jgi:hypothetical protein
MNARIFNREYQKPADGWYQIEAKGFHPATATDGTKVVQVVDDKAIASIVNRFNADAAVAALPHGNEMLIDHEHFRHQADKETLAYGWANKLRATPDGSGFDTFNPWTGTGDKAVSTGDYRFFSTEYDGPEGDVFEPVPAAEIPVTVRNKYKGYEFLRPLKLTGLSLTNDNNNKGQKAITITNRGMQILNAGDLPGHPFHGNQWADGEAGSSRLEAHKQNLIANSAPNHEAGALAGQKASEAANKASEAANKRGDEQSHTHAMVAHREARQAHEGLASMTDDKKEQKFHEAEAEKHATSEKEHGAKIGIHNKTNFAGADASADITKNKQPRQNMKLINAELGLSAEAEESAGVAEIRKLKNRNTALEPVAAENETLKTRNTELEGDQVETLMDAHGMKPDAPARTALKPVLIGLKNREARVSFLKECVTVVPAAVAAPQTKLFNRDTIAPGGRAGVTDESDPEAVAVKINNRATELRATGLKFDAAWNKAKRELTNKSA